MDATSTGRPVFMDLSRARWNRRQFFESQPLETIPEDPPSPTLSVPSIAIHPPSDSEDQDVQILTAEFLYATRARPRFVNQLNDTDFDFIFTDREPPPLRVPKKLSKPNPANAQASSSKMASNEKDPDQGVSSDSETTLAMRLGNLLNLGRESSSREGSPKEEPKEHLKEEPKHTLEPGDFIFDKPMSIDEAAMLAVSPIPFQMPPDKLPVNDKKALEGRLNFHLSELDYLKKYINLVNDNIEQTTHRATMVANRSGPDDERMVRLTFELTNAQRCMRNVAKPFVSYHRQEIDKIAQIRVQMNVDAGLGPRMPQIFKGLANDYEWVELFLI